MLKTSSDLLLAITCLLLSGCKPAKEYKKKLSDREFEGIITYHEIAKSSTGIGDLDDTVQLFYTHGNFVNIHSEKSAKFHIIKDYYFESQPLRLLLFNTSDTLHQLLLNFPIEKLDSFKVRKISDLILSKKCENIEVNISYAERDSTSYTDMSFTFSRGYLNVDKQHFKNWNLGFFNKIIDESGAFYLKFKTVHFDSSHKNILSSKTYDVINVKEQPVDPKIFAIDTTLIK